ncbi:MULTISPECIES: hypothetical protein [unclassified Exiguobacterium]|uniref:hypothetical protein n=1 Tax=unclassified Exiguobacterium TaxID=2644629 RepID=UPI00103DDD6C|nr:MULTISPECIES: hypothetical protein [unclassified Exiguobacterium]TCI24370.1 hypothetical protein EVJ32_14490 [Exiguobacterium sp. SH5S4]TCI56140.1 hypothetical protein EVJ30_04435 [Exiguobacterium sp. SH5S13]TCI61722.1 hypothetical protein EVJ26_09170 [Exiguobacterium sp. SH3S1]
MDQVRHDVKRVVNIRRYGVPIWIVYMATFLFALFFEQIWLIPLMWLLAIFLIIMGNKEYRIMRHFAETFQTLKLLRIQYAMTWLDALLLSTSMTALVLNHSIGFLIGALFAMMRFTDSYRDRLIRNKLKAVDPDMPTYDQVIERMKP